MRPGYRYDINKRPVESGGGYQVHLFVGGTETDGGTYLPPTDPEDRDYTALWAAVDAARAWLDDKLTADLLDDSYDAEDGPAIDWLAGATMPGEWNQEATVPAVTVNYAIGRSYDEARKQLDAIKAQRLPRVPVPAGIKQMFRDHVICQEGVPIVTSGLDWDHFHRNHREPGDQRWMREHTSASANIAVEA